MIRLVILSFLFFHILCCEFGFKDEINKGKNICSFLEHKAKWHGEYCTDALADLHAGCKQLGGDKNSCLALGFANCF